VARPGAHQLPQSGVDGRDKPGHDDTETAGSKQMLSCAVLARQPAATLPFVDHDGDRSAPPRVLV